MGLKSSTIVQDSDAHCPRGHCFFYATLAKIQIQGFNIKESKPKKSRSKETKLANGKTPAPPHFEFTEPGKTFRIDEKREYLEKNWD